MVVKQVEGLGYSIMAQRYLYPGEKTWSDRARVIAQTAARAEKDDEKSKYERKFFETLASGDLVPGGRIIYGSGRSKQNLLNCFSDDTLVFTETGFKKITEVNIGDCVLTHKNRFRPVVNKFPQGVREKLLQIKLYNYNDSFALKVTPDHKIMTPNGYVEAASLKRGDMVNIPALDGIITPTTIKISDFVDSKYVVEGDVIGLPCKMNGKKHPKGGIIGKWNGKTCNNVIPINIDFGLWIGYFLSEGCAPAHKNGIKFTFNSKEIDYIQDVVKLGKSIFGVDGSISPSKAGEWTDVIFNSRILNEFHRNYLGDKFNTKILPWYFVSNEIDPEIQKEILVGLFRGDGSPYNRERSKATVLTLANPTLVFQAHMISNVLKLHSSFTYNPRVKKETHSAQGSLRLFSTTVNYELYNQIYGTNYTSDVRYGMIQEITEIPYGREVWDISVEEDHSLVANGIVASNCYQVSPDDNVNSIAKLLADVYKISCGGGGIGFSFSNIRPKGDDIQNIPNSAPGSVSVIKMINAVGDQVRAGKNRRTALLGSLSVKHPDILDFLHVKLDKKELNNFNISVEINDEFIKACENDEEWSFRFGNKDYFVYQVDRVNKRLKKRETINIVALSSEDAIGRGLNHYLSNGDDTFENAIRYPLRAKELWDRIWTNAVEAGCPGILNMGFANTFTNVSYFEKLMSSNPCVVGSTIVACADGKGDRTIEELANLGKDIPVFCLDTQKNKITVRTLRSPRKTGTKVPVYKITFSDGNSIVSTDNHKWITVDGKTIETKDLKRGDSLPVLSKFEARFDEALNSKMENSQDYIWLEYNNKTKAEHRLISEFHHNIDLKNLVVHHKDFNGKNNLPENLQVMTPEDHTKLHTENMVGDKNPMRRAKTEWPESKWDSYKTVMSNSTKEEKNGRYLGVSNDELYQHALALTKTYGRRISIKEWESYAKDRNLPTQFSKWRNNHFNGISGFLKRAAVECNFLHINEDPRLVRTLEKLLAYGYDAEISNGVCYVIKNCECCGNEFKVEHTRKEVAYCSIQCSTKNTLNIRDIQVVATKNRIKSLSVRKEEDRIKQLSVYTELAQKFGRSPTKKEWEAVCRERAIRFRLGGYSPFNTYADLVSAASTFNHRVESVEFFGYEDVYNGTVDEFHNFFVGGFEAVSKFGKKMTQYLPNWQCGEQILPNYGNCCLANINLANMVENGEVNWSRLASSVKTGIRFLDNILTENYFPIEECREVGHKSRRIGLGVMGLHYMLIDLGLRYGSEKCLEFLERLFSTIRNEAYLASVYLSEERGAFPAFDADKFLKEEFAKTLPARIRMLIKQKGIRNAVMLNCPPTGTISMVFGTSTGIEPIFAPIYKRRYRKGNAWAEEVVVDPLLHKKYKDGMPLDKIKSVFVGAYDVTPAEHMAVQATIQKFVDSALSKTINLPSTATAKEFSDIALAYAPSLKGLTVYREGSKENAPLEPIELSEDNLKKYVNIEEVNTQVSDGAACTIGSGECGA